MHFFIYYNEARLLVTYSNSELLVIPMSLYTPRFRVGFPLLVVCRFVLPRITLASLSNTTTIATLLFLSLGLELHQTTCDLTVVYKFFFGDDQ